MDQISVLDDSIERLSRIADELEIEVAPCPASRLRLVAWVTEWVRSQPGLTEIEQGLPTIPQSRASAYTVWIHNGSKLKSQLRRFTEPYRLASESKAKVR